MPALYSKMPLLAGFGGLSSHRLCISAAEPLVHFQRTAQTMAVQLHCVIKKGFSIREKGVCPSVLRPSTRSVSQGTEVTSVTEYVT